MVQNVHHWLLERDQFTWAKEHLSHTKWFQITKYFPGYKLRRQMMYLDAESGRPVGAEGGEEVPQGRVYLYGLDVRNFAGIEVPGLDDAMTATRKSRMAQRSGPGEGAASEPAAEAVNTAGAASGATAAAPSESATQLTDVGGDKA